MSEGGLAAEAVRILPGGHEEGGGRGADPAGGAELGSGPATRGWNARSPLRPGSAGRYDERRPSDDEHRDHERRQPCDGRRPN